MEKPIRIRISSIQTCSPSSIQDKGFQQSVHSHSPVLASEELVFSHFESHNRLSQGTSCSSGFGITTSGKSTPSESSYVASSRLEVVRSQIRGRHISEFATQCISIISDLNKAPYEPLKTADIKYITLKAVFLLTFAAARRRSEIHALSIEEGCFRYDRNSDSITLLTQPGFLAKNQLPESLPEPIVIPGRSQFCGSDTDDRLFCPVRAVIAYLSRVKAKRLGRKRLFLPLKGSKDISPSTISRWICDVIKLAYADLSSSDLSFMKS